MAVLLVGAIIGFLVSRDDTPPTTTAAPVTTTTTTTTAPTTTSTTIATTTSSTEPEPSGEQIILTAVEDTVVDNEAPDTNFGDAPVLEIEQDGTDTRRALIGFDVTEIPEGGAVASASLALFQIDASEEGALVSFVDGEWTETETTWNTAPPVGAPITPLAGGLGAAVVEVDVTSAVTGNGRVSFYLSTESDDGLDFDAREGTTPPALIITLAEEGASGSGRGSVLVGAGDIASCDSDGDEVTAGLIDQVIAEADDAVVFTAGDNAYEDGSEASFTNCYDPSWGQHRDITRPAVGSREYRTAGAAPYFAYFGEAAGDPAEGYYSYNFAGWHIIVVNSNCTEIGGCEAGSPQEVWLRQDLADHSTSCTLAYWHQPLFSSRSGGTNPEMLPIFTAFDEADGDVVINGNDHFYERFLPQDPEGSEDEDGVTQFTVGTGGRSLDEFLGPSANSATRFNESFGVLALSLYSGGYDWDYVTPEGTPFTDRGSATCH
ncbi:MAG: DUF7594 domain-containing protein [Acidimicrobiia bacterium]